MKHTEEEILEKAKIVMADLRGKYYREASVLDAFFTEDKKVLSGVHEGEKMPLWTVTINSLFDNLDFLMISDETNEPIYYQNFNTFTNDIGKNEDGAYYLVGVE